MFAAILLIRPSGPMKMMSSESGVFFIQKLFGSGTAEGKIIPSSSPSDVRNIRPLACASGLAATSTLKASF